MSKTGDMVRKYRIKNNLSQIQLGSKLGWGGQYVSNIERGKSGVPPRKARKMADAIKIPVGKLKLAVLSDMSEQINKMMR